MKNVSIPPLLRKEGSGVVDNQGNRRILMIRKIILRAFGSSTTPSPSFLRRGDD
jgi:hypothetical protein